METYTSQFKERPLWTTFYPSFLRDIERLSPEINADDECCRLKTSERIFGSEQFYAGVLPLLGKALDAALAAGAALKLYPVFKEMSALMVDGEGYPSLLGPYWRRIFSSSRTGYLGRESILYPRYDIRDRENCKISFEVFTLRQFCLAFSKVTDIEPSVSVDEEIQSFIQRTSRRVVITTRNDILSNARRLLREVLCDEAQTTSPAEDSDLHPALEQWIAVPFGAHGPGAVSQGEQGKEKWCFDAIAGINSEVYEYLPSDFRTAIEACEDVRLANQLRYYNSEVSRFSRLAIVPKDFRGHRLICIEPKELQFAQQGLMRVLYDIVHGHFLTRRSIDFRHQHLSSRLAKSLTFATIDLKDASDLLSIELGRTLLPRRFFKLVTRYRSSKVDVDGNAQLVRCLATMGNALCFPLETLIFWAISLGAMLAHDGIKTGKPGFLQKAARYRLRVFGDDIIVPASHAGTVIKALENSGLVVNQAKTCVDGLAREACGSWYYNQDDVRVIRFKTSRSIRPESWIGFLEDLNSLRDMGFKQTYQSIQAVMTDTTPLCGWVSKTNPPRWARRAGVALNNSFYRWNDEFQRVEFWMPVEKISRRRSSPLHGFDGIYAHFTAQATNSLHLESPRNVEWCWVPLASS